ncbi:MAG: FAD-dependent oxidoreductase [Candidatus Micrarchaeota archaeon]|nr:FAD-dependent oxidoreductase [Candidatus Micrarchaeota archaeon]
MSVSSSNPGEQMNRSYDAIIVGGGITGTSLLYALSAYTDVKSALLIEKYSDYAQLNSNSRNNAQTLHFGDIETNYSKEKAISTKAAAKMVLRYCSTIPAAQRNGIIQKCQKMVLAVDDFEIESIEKIYQNIGGIFPELRRVQHKEIAKLEPNVVKGRDRGQKIAALYSPDGYMMDFGLLTRNFAMAAKRRKRVRIDAMFDTVAKHVSEGGEGYTLHTSNGSFTGKAVVFAAGTYSLYFAKSLGYEKNLSILSVGGNFYYTPRVLRGKVYRVQRGHIPFAAVHGDPEITNPDVTRFGPTVSLPMELERHHPGTMLDYVRTFDFDMPTAASLKRIMLDRDILSILSRNILYDLPLVGKGEFLKREASLIVPSLKPSDLTFAKDIGGIRPQIIDENKRSLVLGEAKLKESGLIFNITPSPGATSCLANAVEDARYLSEYLGCRFDDAKAEKELGPINYK